MSSFVIALARILIIRLHVIMTPVYGFSIVIKLLTSKLIEHYKVVCCV